MTFTLTFNGTSTDKCTPDVMLVHIITFEQIDPVMSNSHHLCHGMLKALFNMNDLDLDS